MPTIQTSRLLLRPLGLSDLETAHAYAGNPENTEYMIYLPNKTKQKTKDFLQRVEDEWKKEAPQFYEFAVTLDGRHIGAVSVWISEKDGSGMLGWIIHNDYQGKGYATEAAKALADFAVNGLKLPKIVACCDYRNARSVKIMEKIGLTLESDTGVRRYRGSDEDIQELKYSLEE